MPVPKRANPRQCQSQTTTGRRAQRRILLLVAVIMDVLMEVEELLLVYALVVDVLPVDVPVVDVLLEVLVEVEEVLVLLLDAFMPPCASLCSQLPCCVQP